MTKNELNELVEKGYITDVTVAVPILNNDEIGDDDELDAAVADLCYHIVHQVAKASTMDDPCTPFDEVAEAEANEAISNGDVPLTNDDESDDYTFIYTKGDETTEYKYEGDLGVKAVTAFKSLGITGNIYQIVDGRTVKVGKDTPIGDVLNISTEFTDKLFMILTIEGDIDGCCFSKNDLSVGYPDMLEIDQYELTPGECIYMYSTGSNVTLYNYKSVEFYGDSECTTPCKLKVESQDMQEDWEYPMPCWKITIPKNQTESPYLFASLQ